MDTPVPADERDGARVGAASVAGDGTQDVLRKVYVEPTNSCNLACATCVRHSWDEPEGFMEWDAFAAVVDGLRASGGGTVAFMGLGEPLLHPRFLEMVQAAKGAGLRVEVTTNALLLHERLAAGLLEAGLDQLVVSIDGASEDTFGRVRSGASLETVVENVARLNEYSGSNYGPGMRIGIEFVAMRSTLGELPGLSRLAARLAATFVIVSNVVAYTPDLLTETLYDHGAGSLSGAETSAAPRWHLPALDWDAEVGAALGAALRRAGPVGFFGAEPEQTRSHCPFVEAGACAVAWDGAVSPCPPLLHTYSCFVRGRAKTMVRWHAGRLPDERLRDIWAKPEYVALRERVRRFDFPPCTDCGCELAETNEQDCLDNPHPVCGDCLWARGIVRCA